MLAGKPQQTVQSRFSPCFPAFPSPDALDRVRSLSLISDYSQQRTKIILDVLLSEPQLVLGCVMVNNKGAVVHLQTAAGKLTYSVQSEA